VFFFAGTVVILADADATLRRGRFRTGSKSASLPTDDPSPSSSWTKLMMSTTPDCVEVPSPVNPIARGATVEAAGVSGDDRAREEVRRGVEVVVLSAPAAGRKK